MSQSSLRRTKVRRDAAAWRRIFSDQQASGLTQQAYCRSHGIGLSTFSRWQQTLAGSGAMVSTAGAHPFVALEPPVTSRDAAAWDLELELGAGVVLRLRRG